MNPSIGLVVLVSTLASAPGFAGVGNVYAPTVELGEVEFEMKGLHQDSGELEKLKLGLGYGVTDFMFVEGYLIADRGGNNLEIEAYELESRFQLSEQGQYWADFGMLAEVEKERGESTWEIKIGPLVQKRFGNFVTTANLLFEQSFGDDVAESELETQGAFQLRYLLGPSFEPGLEYYVDEHTNALGPVAYGETRFGAMNFGWEFGLLFGLDSQTDDTQVRWLVEFEF